MWDSPPLGSTVTLDLGPWGKVLVLSGLAAGAAFLALIVVATYVYARRDFRLQERRHRWRAGLCANCGYDLAGNISGVCPECGTRTGMAVGR